MSGRYVLNGSLKEMLMDFVPVVRITGSAIAEAFLSRLSLWKLPMENLRGQCYDGSSNMAGAPFSCNPRTALHLLRVVTMTLSGS